MPLIIVGLLLMGVGLLGIANFFVPDGRKTTAFGEGTGEIIGQNLFVASIGAVIAIVGAVTTPNVNDQLVSSPHPSSCPTRWANADAVSSGCSDFASDGV
jgi:hypothetical protein